MNAELSEFLGSSSALTDCFTSSNLLLIRSVISDKCGRRCAERGILAQSRLAFAGSAWITGHPEVFHLAGKANGGCVTGADARRNRLR